MFPLHNTLPDCSGLRLGDFVLTADTAVALLVSTAPSAICPKCGTPSDRVPRRAIGFALGGEAGERLTERLGMPTSPV
jgi:hypothetical protein